MIVRDFGTIFNLWNLGPDTGANFHGSGGRAWVFELSYTNLTAGNKFNLIPDN